MTCSICGFGRDAGVHLPALSGPREGLPWGHTYIDRELNYPPPPPDPKPGDYEPGDVPSPQASGDQNA